MKRTFTDAEKLEYWRNKARVGSNNSQQKNYYSKKDEPQFKKSGATFTKISKGHYEGLHHVSAWKKNKWGLVRLSASPLANKSIESAKGNQFIPYLATVTHMPTLQSTKYNAIMNIQTKVLVIDELGMCVTPNGTGKTGTGTTVKGYFGTYNK